MTVKVTPRRVSNGSTIIVLIVLILIAVIFAVAG